MLLTQQMCRHYGIKRVPNVILDDGTILKNVVGRLVNNDTIIVKRQQHDIVTLHVFYHEFRHVWQWSRYQLLVAYYESHTTVYNLLYDKTAIEIDAEQFARRCSQSQGRFWRYDDCYSRSRNLDMVQSALLAHTLYNATLDPDPVELA